MWELDKDTKQPLKQKASGSWWEVIKEWVIQKLIYLVHYLDIPVLITLNSNKVMGSVSHYAPWNICSEHLKVTCFPGRNKNTWSHSFVSHSLRATGWRKAAISQPRWNPARELGLQHLWPEELHPRYSSTYCVRTHSSRGHGSPQYRGPPAGAPQRPAGPVPSSGWGLSKAFCE